MKQFLLIIAAAFSILSCDKIESNIDEDSHTDPIYKLHGNIDGEPFDYIVDNENIIMTQGSEMMNNVSSFYTVFENKRTNTSLQLSLMAPERIRKNLNDYALADRDVSFLVHSKGCYNLGFSQSIPNPPLIMYSHNGQFVSSESIEVPGYGIYEIPLRFKGLSNETYKFTINHGFEGHNFSAKYELSNSNQGIKYKSSNTESDHKWYLNGQLVGSSSEGNINAMNGINTIMHVVTDNFGNSCSESTVFYSESNYLKWMFETTYCESEPVDNNFEELVITYIENGVTYSSAFAEENDNQTIAIKNIEYFTESTDPSVISFKFDTEFDGVLYNEDKSKKKILSEVTGTCKYRIE